VKPGAIDLGGLPALGNDPERWAQLRSNWTPHLDVDLDIGVRYVGALQLVVPAYTVVDVRLAWRPVQHVELSLTAQNAGNRDYYEWSNGVLVERSFFFKVAWRP
jgi:iron complex outermembrane receptor protein